MRRRKEEYKQNNFNGNVNFTGKTQIAAGDIINNISEEKQKTANYDPEPKWRSPFTLAVLTWISTIIAIVGIFPFAKIVKSIVCFFRGMNGNTISLDMQKYSIIFIIFVFLFLIFFTNSTGMFLMPPPPIHWSCQAYLTFCLQTLYQCQFRLHYNGVFPPPR